MVRSLIDEREKIMTQRLMNSKLTCDSDHLLFIYEDRTLVEIYSVDNRDDIIEALRDYGYADDLDGSDWDVMLRLLNVQSIEDVAIEIWQNGLFIDNTLSEDVTFKLIKTGLN